MVDYKTRNWLDRYVSGCFFIAGFAPLWDCTQYTTMLRETTDARNRVEQEIKKMQEIPKEPRYQPKATRSR